MERNLPMFMNAQSIEPVVQEQSQVSSHCTSRAMLSNYEWICTLVVTMIFLLPACNSQTASIVVSECQQNIDLGIEKSALEGQHPELRSIGGVAALAFNSDGTLRVVYSSENVAENGHVVALHLPTLQPQEIISLGRVNVNLTRMSPNSEKVYSAVRKDCPNYPYLKNSECWDIQGWDTKAGNPVWLPESPNVDLRDFALSADGKWILKAKGGSGIDALVPNNSGHGFAFFREDAIREITAATFSSKSDLVALGFRDETYLGNHVSGAVQLSNWDGQNLRPPVTEDLFLFKLYTAEKRLSFAPIALAMDSTSSWLAVLTTESVELLDIPSMNSTHRNKEIPQTSTGVVSFSPSSAALAVGYSSGISIFGVPDFQVLLSKHSLQVTSISFSPDGCLLAWGDVNGTVHITNAPKP